MSDLCETDIFRLDLGWNENLLVQSPEMDEDNRETDGDDGDDTVSDPISYVSTLPLTQPSVTVTMSQASSLTATPVTFSFSGGGTPPVVPTAFPTTGQPMMPPMMMMPVLGPGGAVTYQPVMMQGKIFL
jgi:hypothetical protein